MCGCRGSRGGNRCGLCWMRGCVVRPGRRCLLRWGPLLPLLQTVSPERRVLEHALQLERRVPPRAVPLVLLPARVVAPLALRRQAVLAARPVLLWLVRSRVAALVLVPRMARLVRPPGLVLPSGLVLRAALF